MHLNSGRPAVRRLGAVLLPFVAVVLTLTSCEREAVSPELSVAPLASLSMASTAVPPVVISQIYGGGGNSNSTYTHDFVELFNPGQSDVAVGGWSVQYASATGSTWNVSSLPAGATIPAGGYYLVQMAAGGGGTTPLPTADATGGANMSATAGKVALASSGTALSGTCPAGTTVVDIVGFGGTANCGTPTPAPSNTTAVLRHDDGCRYTGNPGDDFVAGAPSPRNSASPKNPCAAPEPPASVRVTPEEADILTNGTVAFRADAYDAGGRPVAAVFTWTSSNTAVATVDDTGVATGVSAGTTTITARTSNGIEGSATLRVAAGSLPDVVISQVYGGGGNSSAPYTHDFIELFNRGTTTVDLTGWRLHYASASGTTWNNTVNLPATTLVPGRYLLVELSGGSVGQPLPAPDASGAINMAAGSGKVVLTLAAITLSGDCPSDPTVVDRVNYGTGNCGSAWGNTPTLSNTSAALRKDAGCQQTGSSSTDFVAGAPTPRNTASPRYACAGPGLVEVTPASPSVEAGSSVTLSAAGQDAFGPTTSSYAWSSSAPAVATVDAQGLVTGVGAGNAVITATAPNGVSGAANVTVTRPPARTGLVITEFMADPDGDDALGEWFELYNAGDVAVNLHGWQIHSRSSGMLETHTIAADVVIPAGGFVVLGNNANVTTNGGVDVAYSYGGDIILNNSNTDWFRIRRPDGTTEDSVAYSNWANVTGTSPDLPHFTPLPSTSRVLIDIDLDNSLAASANWANSAVPYGDGRNRGSPGWGAYGTAGPVASVRVLPATQSVLVGGTAAYSAIALDDLGRVSTAALTWSSSHSAVATINSSGVATGVTEGTAQIIATAASGVQGTASIAVVHPNSPASVTVGVSDPAWLPVGYTKRVFATVRNHNGDIIPPEVTWSVANPDMGEVFTVDGTRYYVHTLAPGTITIVATAANGVQGQRSFTVLPAEAPTPAVYGNHTEFGRPTSTSLSASNDILVERSGFVSSFNPARGGPNWVSWNLNGTQFGRSPRCDCFSPDPLLGSVPQPFDSDYIGGGYDRGHMVQSESRTSTEQENAATFYFTNILPQAPVNNQQSWLAFENYTNSLARTDGKELYVIAGGEYGANPQTVNNAGRIHIPEFTWKIAVIMDAGQGLADVRTPDDMQVIAIRMPNLVETAQATNQWQNFTVTVASIEEATGFRFLTALPEWIRSIVVSGTSRPTADAGGPYTGVAGFPIAFDGSASSDPDVGDVLSFAWSFGDGAAGTGPLPQHTYAAAGTYDVRLIVADQYGAADTTYTTTTVYPVANVAAGGTFDVPAGAIVASPTAAGRANLAATVRHNAAGAVVGTIELYLNSAGFRFTADAFTALAVEGERATIRGTGRLRNDASQYTFELVLTHGVEAAGRARMVIRQADGAVVFDNLPGQPAAASAVVNGSVRVR
jgi:DNA/RNA endonuclease G (NUC1)